MISPDLPITKSSKDELNRGFFVKSLAHVLLQSSFPASFTVGLYGAWGSGKTSLLNMIIENVEKANSEIVVLRFNPWLCSDSRQLIIQFFKQLSGAIKIKKPAANTMCELVDRHADIFDAASLLPGVGTAIAAAGKAAAKGAQSNIENKANDLQSQKNQIIQKMTEKQLKIIVTIDDIDRLSKEKIIAISQLVRALADFPNVVYFLRLTTML